MENQEQYADLVERLVVYGYIIVVEKQGFSVQHIRDTADISHMRDLNDLIDFTELIEWREQRKAA